MTVEHCLLIRHAAPQLGWHRPYNEFPGPPLSDLGLRQARELAEFVARLSRGSSAEPLSGSSSEEGIAVHSSPFERARQTADIVAARIGASVLVSDALQELLGGESLADMASRVRRAWDALVTTESTGFAIVVTHGSPMRALLESLGDGSLDISAFQFDYGNPCPPAGAWMGRATSTGYRWALAFQPTEGLDPTQLSSAGGAFGTTINE